MRPPRRLRGRTTEEEDVGSSTPQPAKSGPRRAYQPTQTTRKENHVKTHQHLTGPYIAETAARHGGGSCKWRIIPKRSGTATQFSGSGTAAAIDCVTPRLSDDLGCGRTAPQAPPIASELGENGIERVLERTRNPGLSRSYRTIIRFTGRVRQSGRIAPFVNVRQAVTFRTHVRGSTSLAASSPNGASAAESADSAYRSTAIVRTLLSI